MECDRAKRLQAIAGRRRRAIHSCQPARASQRQRGVNAGHGNRFAPSAVVRPRGGICRTRSPENAITMLDQVNTFVRSSRVECPGLRNVVRFSLTLGIRRVGLGFTSVCKTGRQTFARLLLKAAEPRCKKAPGAHPKCDPAVDRATAV